MGLNFYFFLFFFSFEGFRLVASAVSDENGKRERDDKRQGKQNMRNTGTKIEDACVFNRFRIRRSTKDRRYRGFWPSRLLKQMVDDDEPIKIRLIIESAPRARFPFIFAKEYNEAQDQLGPRWLIPSTGETIRLGQIEADTTTE